MLALAGSYKNTFRGDNTWKWGVANTWRTSISGKGQEILAILIAYIHCFPLVQSDLPSHVSTSLSLWTKARSSAMLWEGGQIWASEPWQAAASHIKQAFVHQQNSLDKAQRQKIHLIFQQVLYCSQTAWEGTLKISSADLHSLNSCSAQKMNHLEVFITLSKPQWPSSALPQRVWSFFWEGIKLSLSKAAFQWGLVLFSQERQTPPGVPQTGIYQ